MGPFLAWLPAEADFNEDSPIDQLHRKHIRAYLSMQAERGLAGMSVDACYRVLNAFCNFCVAEGWLLRSPMENVRRPQREKKIPPAFHQGRD